MGGCVGITIREADGTEHRMCRWTNVISCLNDLRLYEKDSAFIREFNQKWEEMRADYLKHKKDRKFEQNMTEVYAPYPLLAPMEYGLIVIDMQKNIILNYQDASRLGGFDSPGLLLELISNQANRPNSMFTSFKNLFKAGRIKLVVNFLAKKQLDLSTYNFKAIETLLKEEMKSNRHLLTFFIDTAPFELIEYAPNNVQAARKMLAKIKELGFILKAKEEKEWRNWIKENDDE